MEKKRSLGYEHSPEEVVPHPTTTASWSAYVLVVLANGSLANRTFVIGEVKASRAISLSCN